ncbi:MAG: ergothioneine biosynthesis protein EgtB [Phycisphaerales bacterium]|nr:MAG: ergothioneine biosynthesis protein EgtB [Phycisphaerales bacterium]
MSPAGNEPGTAGHSVGNAARLIDRAALRDRYAEVRATTERLCSPLEPEDFNLQTMPNASPAKWHAAHTSWFFERFVLCAHDPSHTVFDERWEYLFNSYYNAVGDRHCRARRGGLTRPTVGEVMRYRWHVDESMTRLLERESTPPEALALIELGLHHEQQHQELLLTDILHGFWDNPLLPTYDAGEVTPEPARDPGEMGFVAFNAGVRTIGHAGDGFAYDHESPRHRVFLEAFEIGDRLVTNAEYAEFIGDGGYARSELWLDEGWAAVRGEGWRGPLYWHRGGPPGDRDAGEAPRRMFTPRGDLALDPHAPVCCVSFFEADAYARWRGCRLATEFEWESACAAHAGCGVPAGGNLLESRELRPLGAVERTGSSPIRQAYGDCWEWTRSDYAPYPGYKAPPGAVGEYNGKFMCGQFVLRGGSFATPRSHLRATYRNFWAPATRWQFSGIRLARGGAEA